MPLDNSIAASEEIPATKRAIYETALRLFARNGFAATGLRELSREAGVNLATVNYFYGSKKGLLKAILDDYFTGVLAVLSENLGTDDAPEAKLRRAVAALARYFAAESDKLIVALTELPHDDPDITDFKAEWCARLMDIFQTRLIDEMGEAARHAPVTILAPSIVGLVASLFLFHPVIAKLATAGQRAEGAATYPDLMAELFVNGFNGVLANPPGGNDD